MTDPKTPYRSRYYDGTLPTARPIRQILPRLLEEIGRLYKDRPDLVLAAWPDVIGPRLAPMSRALSFSEGILCVKVGNSTLLSLLTRDKPRLIKNLRDKFPGTLIKTILFRLG